jgi:hypothetical protein
MDEKTVTVVGRDDFAQLLQGPGSRRVVCDITMHNPPGLVFDDYQDVERSERCGNDDAEVTGHNGRGMIAKKS